MALHRDHRHNPTAPIGLILLKLAVGVGAAVLKKKLVDRLTSKLPEPSAKPGQSTGHAGDTTERPRV